MLTEFDRIESRMLVDMQKSFGSPWALVPMKSRPNRQPVQDASRDVLEICGILYEDHAMSDLDKNGRIDKAGRKKSMSFNSFSAKSIILNLRICDLPWEPRQFDMAICKANGREYEILDVQPSGHSDVNLRLSEKGGPYGAFH
jgi:hypothetical protein